MQKTRYIFTSLLAGMFFVPLNWLYPVSGFADVCNEGIGIPPFLSSGTKPNLLMVLDNSGSMLDMAYSSSRDDARCLDGDYEIVSYDNQGNKQIAEVVTGYDSAKTYGGYFESETWYNWAQTGYTTWKTDTSYTEGDRVYAYGNIYVATSTGTSSGTTIDKDTQVDWERIFSIKKWANNTLYPAKSFAWDGPRLYLTEQGGTSNDPDQSNGLQLSDDTAVAWTAVDSTWQNNSVYNKGDIVTYKGVYYESTSANGTTSSGTGVDDDSGVNWTSLRQGEFRPTDETTALAFCSGASGSSKYTHDDLCISLDNSASPTQVSAFAAQGNFLNWAMASRFDIEKKILTGGKYSYDEGVIVGEHRGCSGSRFIKQIKLNNGQYLTFGVRGSTYDDDFPFLEDRIDTTDDTARLEIIAVTADGFQPSEECQAALDYILTHGMTGASLKQDIEACFETFPITDPELVDQNSMLNHSLQFCSKVDSGNLRDTGVITAECKKLYEGDTYSTSAYDPSDLVPAYGAYVCYGIYDPDLSHLERAGYIGRCWKPVSGAFKTCLQKPAVSQANGGCDISSSTCIYQSGSDYFMNKSDGYNYICTANNQKNCTASKNNWDPVYYWRLSDGSDGGFCQQGDIAPGATGADWENATDAAYVEECVVQASIDYCNDAKLPEVIDPSDQAGDTTNYWNVPGLLTDSEAIAQLGATHPLAVMKGYIEQDERPEGMLHSVANELRLGAMAFNYVGAATECKPENLVPGIERYCPQGNRDGAELITALEAGDLVMDANDPTYASGKRRHVDDLAESVNSIQANSWTPLGEALYTALGYYTQNEKFCLTKDENGACVTGDDGNPVDFPVDNDPVQYWCQDNHILLITEGESTADINADVAAFAESPDSHYVEKLAEDNVAGDAAGDDTNCADSLYAATFLDDMTWWGQEVWPLYKDRYVVDPDGVKTQKSNIFTHVVTTGTLSATGAGECIPEILMQAAAVNGGTENYYPGEDPEKLEKNLYAILDDILSRSSSGSAASVISSSRSGAGAVYQAVFWPNFEDEDGNTVSWVGDVHGLFMRSDGRMYEDTDRDGMLSPSSVTDNSDPADTDDKQVLFYFSDAVNRTRACYNIDGFYSNGLQCPGDADWIDTECPTPGEACEQGRTCDCVEITDIKYLWSANDQLRDMDTSKNRSTPVKRKIFTWNDANNNGIVDLYGNEKDEWFQLNSATPWSALNSTAAETRESAVPAGYGPPRGPVTEDFLTSFDWGSFVSNDGSDMEQDALNALVEWLEGYDQLNNESSDDNGNDRLDKELRSRQFRIGGDTKEWRLGDIIHSTPLVVSKPAEAYHYIYRDPTYSKFADKWATRRNVVYFGGNDGMLHAVNAGFYIENTNQFCCSEPVSGTCSDPVVNGSCGALPHLGDELWAYIPYNLQPHLKCLAGKFYSHKYFVDQRPRVFDVQIFEEEAACTGTNGLLSEDCIHAGGWGTILVGSMRFGGAPITAVELNGLPEDTREFSSSFFILDITNPEADPVLLGELTRTTDTVNGDDTYADLNYTTSSPSMIIMRNSLGTNNTRTDWYLAMGSGPTNQDGSNDNTSKGVGKIAVLPLAWLQGSLPDTAWSAGIPESGKLAADKQAIRIPNTRPSYTSQAGVFLVPQVGTTDPSYISDLISVDFDVELTAPDNLGARYRTDALYFGTTDGTDFSEYPPTPGLPDNDQTYWDGGGRLFRLVSKVVDSSGTEGNSKPSNWASRWADNEPIRLLADVKEPMVGAPVVGFDGTSFWVYAGVGRFYDERDKTDDGRLLLSGVNSKISFFGIKEPIFDAANTSVLNDWNDMLFGVTCVDNVLTWDTVDWNINNQNNDDLNHDGIPGKRGLMQVDDIIVAEGTTSRLGNNISYLDCMHCKNSSTDPSVVECTAASECFPINDLDLLSEDIGGSKVQTFPLLRSYIAGNGCTSEDAEGLSTGLDGWYREFHESRERNLGQGTLLGGLLTYSTYQPFNDKCKVEGQSYLYGVHYQTGTAWTESVFGLFKPNGGTNADESFVKDRVSLGRGLATTPSLHVGTGDQAASAFIQTSTGEIVEIKQDNLPLENAKSGRQSWTDRCEN
ncbi:PilC beta-propeller domain-containing protein [Candidatus Electrothrix aarhusensis]